MTFFLKALLGVGAVATASTVAVVSSKSLLSSSSTVESVKALSANTDNLSQLSQNTVDRNTNKSASSPDTSYSKVNESANLKAQGLTAQRVINRPSLSQSSPKNLSEAEKYKERLDNPELCRLILSSESDGSKVQACRLSKDSLDLEFIYHTGTIGEMPIPVKNLRYTYNQLVVNLEKRDSFGLTEKRLDLSHEIIAGRGLIPANDVSDKTFTNKQCKLVLASDSALQKGEWKIGCQIAPK